MNKIFITYGDSPNFEESKKRIIAQAKSLNIFDKAIAYSRDDCSEEVQTSTLMRELRGGGLWVWKPDIIYRTLNEIEDGDILIYCDAGCTLSKSKDWAKFFDILSKYDICALRINQRNDNWTRKEIINYFGDGLWLKQKQCCATIIIKKSSFSLNFIKEWRTIMIQHPDFVRDVTKEEMSLQLPQFIENRHDQSIYSALIYKYLDTGKIKIIWEHMEGYDYFSQQAIFASRIKANHPENKGLSITLKNIFRWAIKHLYYQLKNS